MTQTAPPDLTIVICTFRRERLLRRALESAVAMRRPAGFGARVVVVDNSDEGSAEGVVADVRALASRGAAPLEIVAVAAHPANIAVARNAGIAATDSTFVAFVDDDQQLDPGWLEGVALAARTLSHDVFFGPVEPEFEAPERATAAVRQLFTRRLDAPLGRDLFALGPEKMMDFALSTANSVFRRATTLADHGSFDLAYGSGGGEDYDLLCRLQRRGRRFGWAPLAKASEFVPAARCEAAYLRRRFFAGGQAFASAIAGVSDRPRAARWGLRAKAVLQALVLLAQAPAQIRRGREARLDYTYRWAGVLGKISIGEILPVYQIAAPARLP